MSVLLFFGKNSFETSCGGNTKWVFDIVRSTILYSRNFTFSELVQHFPFCPLNPSCLQQVMVKMSPLIPGLEHDLRSHTLIIGGYGRSGTGT